MENTTQTPNFLNHLKKEYYSCDAGSLAIYLGGSIDRIRNEYGDKFGLKVYFFDDEESNNSFEEYISYHEEKYNISKQEYHYIKTVFYKNAKVLDYDCYNTLTLDNIDIDLRTLCELNGWYSIYVNYGKVYFVKENDFHKQEHLELFAFKVNKDFILNGKANKDIYDFIYNSYHNIDIEIIKKITSSDKNIFEYIIKENAPLEFTWDILETIE